MGRAGTSGDSEMTCRYTTFSGSEEATTRVQAGQELVLAYLQRQYGECAISGHAGRVDERLEWGV